MTDQIRTADEKIKRTGYEQTEPPKTSSDSEIDAIQELFGTKYRILRQLGKGSQGAVFLAEDATSRQKIAIKQLIVQSVKDWKQYDLFQREAETLKRLDIPGVAKLIGVKEFLDIAEPRAFILQEFIEGEPLQQFIARGHRFQIGQIGDLLLQLLDIIEKLHSYDPPVIHRDIKPSNILLNYVGNSDTPEVHLIDFGAVANPQVKSGGSTVVGTYGYMAPEQLMGHAVPASDIYSLAIVAVYLLSGVAPEELEIQDFHVLIDPHLEHLPYQITCVLRKMLAPKVDDRLLDFETLRQFFTALKTQQFSQIPQVDGEQTATKAYSLGQVKGYHQAGNIELWQALEDKYPRTLPGHLKRFLLWKSIKTAISRLTSKPNFSVLAAIYSFFLTFSVFWTLISVYTTKEFSKTLSPDILEIFPDFAKIHFTVFLPLILCLLIPVIYLCYKTWPEYRAQCSFLKSARKSMATVIRLEYLDIQSNLEDASLFKHGIAYPATWKITYSFNPPDDSSPDALVHTVMTHTEPDKSLEGSLIPILYLIKNDKNGERVLSTPFPVPVTDVLNVAK